MKMLHVLLSLAQLQPDKNSIVSKDCFSKASECGSFSYPSISLQYELNSRLVNKKFLINFDVCKY